MDPITVDHMLFKSGEIIGNLLGYSQEQWQEFANEMQSRPGFRYGAHLQQLVEFRKKLVSET